ncbi:AAA family ATPase, partial [Candidatus Uhrbacteria bacterium]|nr:AAA family ATPase [Candidatus Uhrbacteria bacterium]
DSSGDFRPSRRPNPQQELALYADVQTPLRVLAAPGTGKTFLLSNRYAYLLHCGAEPDEIVSVTFSRAMADEGLERICSVSPMMRALRDDDPKSDEIRQINTIHALCLYMLRKDGDRRVVPDYQGRVKPWMLKAAIQEIAEELWPQALNRPGWKEVMSYIDTAKHNGLSSADDMKFFGSIRDKFGELVGTKLHQARKKFDAWCKRNGVITFADMLFDVEQRLHKDRAFREKWQARIKYVLIDEGQDTNGQAMYILTTLAAPQNNITIVGDTDQLLYRFLGATPEKNLYDGFEALYPSGNTVKLGINYRSTGAIIETYSRLIHHNYNMDCPECLGTGKTEEGQCPYCLDGTFNGPYAARYLKQVEPCPGAPEGVEFDFEMHNSPVSEAKAVALRIKQAIDKGREPDDFFIGARTCAQTGYVEGPLVQLEVPYINLTGGSFWHMKHVQDFIAYLRLAFNENDDEAFERVLNIASNEFVHPWGKQQGEYCHHRYLGKAFKKACQHPETGRPSYTQRWVAARKRRSYSPGVEDMDYLVSSLQAELEVSPLHMVLRMIMEDCYEKYLAADEGLIGGQANDSGKIDDLETVIDIAREFETVPEFVDYVEKARKAAEAAKNGDWSGHVVISTVHRLKGTERPVVYGIGLVEGQDKKGLPVGLLPHTYSLRPPEQRGILPAGGQARIEDERDI